MSTVLLRPSSVGGASDCLYRWFSIHLLGIKSPSGYAAVRGTGVHAGAEQIWTESIKAGQKSFSISAAKDAAAQAVEDEFKSEDREIILDEDKFESMDGAKDEAVKGTEAYADKIVPEVDIPVKVESYYKADLGDDIIIGGTFDALDNDGTIVDIKTTARKAVPGKYIDQLAIYSKLAKANGEKVNGQARIENVVFLKKEVGAHLFNINLNFDITTRKIDDLKQRILWYRNHPDDGVMVFPPNNKSYLCDKKYCPVYDTCPIISEVPF